LIAVQDLLLTLPLPAAAAAAAAAAVVASCSSCHCCCSFISNLDYKVTDEDIQELFGTVGTIKDSGIHYDKRCGAVFVSFVIRSLHAASGLAVCSIGCYRLRRRAPSRTAAPL
jgi:hypothetical protein